MKKQLLLLYILIIASYQLYAQSILGIDVNNKGAINWQQVKAAGKVFAYVKATEGVTFNDLKFTTYMADGKNAGVIMGAYHFARPDNNSAVDEANHFLSIAGSYIGDGYLPPALDLEDPFDKNGNIIAYIQQLYSSSALTTWVQTWMTTIQNATGITPVIYVNSSFAAYLNNSLNNYGLWIAKWDGSPTTSPTNIGVWTTWAFKQYSSMGTVSGISGSVDLNVFNGSLSTFNNLIGVFSQVPPNDNCSDAEPITSNGSCETGTVNNATASGKSKGSCDGYTGTPSLADVWYSFQAKATSHTITVDPSGDLDAVIMVYSSCSSSSPISGGCSDTPGSGIATLSISGLTVGNNYFVRVYDYGNVNTTTGDFSICVTHSGSSGSDDFTVQNASVTPTSVAAGGTIDVSCDQCYSGSKTNANVADPNLGYYLSTNTSFSSSSDTKLGDDYSGIGTDDPCDPESESLTIPAGTAAGSYYILFVSDYDGQVSESNESNNVAYQQITVTDGVPTYDDLTILDATVNPTTVALGAEIEVSCIQKYEGTTLNQNLGRCYVGYFLSEDSFLDDDDNNLGDDYSNLGSDNQTQSESTTLTIPEDISTGIYYILFVADYIGEIPESNENNNVAYQQIIVTNASTLTINPSSLALGASSGSSNQISVSSNVSWTVSDNATWLSVSPTSGSNNGIITVTASSANTSVTSREATVTIIGDGITKTVTVSQSGTTPAPTLSVSTSNLTIANASGSNNTLNITSNVSWTVSDNATWLSVSPTSGSNNGIITVTATSANTSATSREATVTISGGGITKTVIAKQAGQGSLQYIINIAASPESCGTISGGGLYNNGQSCTVTAIENQGYSFYNWTENGVEVSTDRNYTFIVSGARELVAHFIEDYSGYIISTSGEPIAGGIVYGGGSYYYGEACTLTAVANEDFTFLHWIENGIIVSNEINYFFEVAGNRELVAVFRSKDIETVPNAPVSLLATNIFTTSFSANWNHSLGAEGYILDVATNNTFTQFVPGFQNKDIGNVNTFIISGLANNASYYYRLRAYNRIGKSDPSETISVLTKQNQSGTALYIGTTTTVSGSTINVPVSAVDLNSISTMQFTISYDKNKLNFINCTNINPLVNSSEIQINPIEGKITFIYFSNDTPLSVYHDKLFDLSFTLKPNTDGTILIKWDDTPTQREISNIDMELIYCSYIDGSISIISGYSISGQLLYNNIDLTPLGNASISLYDSNNQFIESTKTNSLGYYSFSGISDGVYTLSPVVTLPWGGATAMDLTLYKRHIGGISTLKSVQIKSGDVNKSNSLTSLDLNIIKQRIGAKIQSFDAGDWVFENEVITLNTSNVEQNILSLCTGDANGSYSLASLKSQLDIIENRDGEIDILDDYEIQVPLYISKSVERLASLTFYIDYPLERLEIKDVKMNVQGDDFYYSVNDNVITVVYSSLDPITLQESEPLLYLNFNLKKIENGKIFNESLLKGSGEFGDYNDNVIDDVHLYYDATKLSMLINHMIANTTEVFPNPASDKITITNCEKSILYIYDISGRRVMETASESNLFTFNIGQLRPGIYTMEIIKGKNTLYRKFSVIR